MNSGRSKCFSLLLVSLGVWFQAYPALSQTTQPARRSSGNLAAVTHELRALEPLSPPAERKAYDEAVADFTAGKTARAVQDLRSLHSAAARTALGVILESKGDDTAALAAFRDALKLQPGFAEAGYDAAKLLIWDGRPMAAISQLQSTLDAHGNSDGATFPLKMLLAQTDSYVGQDKAAAKILETLLAERPNSAEVRFNLAMTYARLESLDAAVTQFREGLRISPKDTAGLMGLAKALVDLKKSADAIPVLQEYVRLKPNDAEGYYALGRAFRVSGRSKDAAEALSHAARLKPEDYDIRYHLGMALWQSGQLDAALPQLRAAERLKPSDVQVHSSLSRVLRSLGKQAEARKESEVAERLSGNETREYQTSYCIASGNVLFEQGDLKGAEDRFRQALELDPNSAGARYDLGLVLARSNDREGAKRELQKAIALDPKLPLAYNTLGHIYLAEGHVPEAKAALERAIRINPQYAEAKNSLGTLYARLGNNAQAAALFQEATEDSPDYAEAYLNWGLLLANQGKLERAKPLIEKALQLSPNLAPAQKALQMIDEELGKPH